MQESQFRGISLLSGDMIYGNNYSHAEKAIYIDDELFADTFIDGEPVEPDSVVMNFEFDFGKIESRGISIHIG